MQLKSDLWSLYKLADVEPDETLQASAPICCDPLDDSCSTSRALIIPGKLPRKRHDLTHSCSWVLWAISLDAHCICSTVGTGSDKCKDLLAALGRLSRHLIPSVSSAAKYSKPACCEDHARVMQEGCSSMQKLQRLPPPSRSR